MLREVEPNGPERDLRNVGAIIAKFDELDRDAQTWRYPVDLQGNPTVPKDLFHINLGQVKEVVGRLGGFLDAADAQIGAYLEYKWDAEEEGRAIEAETRAEMRAEYGSG